MKKTANDLQKWLVEHEISPEKKIDYKGIQIFLSDTGVRNDAKLRNDWSAEDKLKFGQGYYSVFWFLGVNGIPRYGHEIIFELLHDLVLSDRKSARLATGEVEAKSFIETGIEKGLFNAAA